MKEVNSLLEFIKVYVYILVKEREAWQAALPGVAKSRTWINDWTTTNVYILI